MGFWKVKLPVTPRRITRIASSALIIPGNAVYMHTATHWLKVSSVPKPKLNVASSTAATMIRYTITITGEQYETMRLNLMIVSICLARSSGDSLSSRSAALGCIASWLSTIVLKPILLSAAQIIAIVEMTNSAAGSSQFELRRRSVKVFVGAINVSTTRSTSESGFSSAGRAGAVLIQTSSG